MYWQTQTFTGKRCEINLGAFLPSGTQGIVK